MSMPITSHDIEKHRIKNVEPLLKQGQADVINAQAKTKRFCTLSLFLAGIFFITFALGKWGNVNAVHEVMNEPVYALYLAISFLVIAFLFFLFSGADSKADQLFDDLTNSWGTLLGWRVDEAGNLDAYKTQAGPVGELVSGEIGKGITFADITGFSQTVFKRITFGDATVLNCELNYDTEVETGEDEDGVTQTQHESHCYFKGLIIDLPNPSSHHYLIYPAKEFGTMMDKRKANDNEIHHLPKVSLNDLSDKYVAYGNECAPASGIESLISDIPMHHTALYISALPDRITLAIATEYKLVDTNALLQANADTHIREQLQTLQQLIHAIGQTHE